METLEFFSKEIAKSYEKEGYDIYTCDMNRKDAKELQKFLSSHETVLITFNFIGLSEEDWLMDGKGSIFDEKCKSINVIMVDHPLYYHDQLIKSSKNVNIFCIDRDHVDYVKKYYPHIHSVTFLPLAGTEIKKEYVPIKNRTIPLLFAGNYVRKERLFSYLEGLDREYREFYLSIVEDLISHTNKNMEEAMSGAILKEIPDIDKNSMAAAIHGMMFVDLYVRSYFRAEVVKEIADAKIPIYVIGKDWNYLEVKHPEYIIPIGNGMEDTTFCLNHMADAKLSLNVMPWFKNGIHDRILSSMLNKSISITDSSKYIEENFGKEEFILYSLDHIKELPTIIRDALKNEDGLQHMAELAYEKCQRNHTWEKRVDILKLV